MKYFDELKRTMEWAAQQPNVIFLGQATGVPGTFMFNTIKEVPETQRVEMPVSESFQMQMTVGAAFSGYLPISIYPRLNFLMLAMGDLANIVDKMPEIYQRIKSQYDLTATIDNHVEVWTRKNQTELGQK